MTNHPLPDATIRQVWPNEIRLRPNRKDLFLAFNNGVEFTLPAEFLRVESPSAEVRGHTPDQRKIIPRCPDVTIAALEPVGHYAMRIIFSDGHDSGLYAWNYLYDLGMNYDEIWAKYLAAV